MWTKWNRVVALVALLSGGVHLSGDAFAQQAAADADVDALALASRLLADGYPDRAVAVLSETDVTTKDLDLARYYMLRGMAQMQLGNDEAAVEDFQTSLQQEGADPLIRLHLAQVQLRRENWDGAIEALEPGREALATMRAFWMLRSRASWKKGDTEGAWVILTQAEAYFPGDIDLPRQRMMLLVDMGLYNQALVLGREILAAGGAAEDWITLGEALRGAGQHEEAIPLLEEARLRYPLNSEVATALARVYLDMGRPKAAGDVLQVAAELDETLLVTAAECFRQAGDIERALYLNSRVADPVEKARQRLGLLLEGQDWARATALGGRLERLGLAEDDAVAYGLAYAWFQLGDTETAGTWLTDIEDPRWFRDATTLREAMQKCADKVGGCR